MEVVSQVFLGASLQKTGGKKMINDFEFDLGQILFQICQIWLQPTFESMMISRYVLKIDGTCDEKIVLPR